MTQTVRGRAGTARWSALMPSLAIGGAILWAGATTDIEAARLLDAGGRIAEFIGRMIPPDLSVMPEVMKGTAETLRIAILGTLGCVAASVGLGLLAAETIAPSWINRPVKLLLALIRSIPMLLCLPQPRSIQNCLSQDHSSG